MSTKKYTVGRYMKKEVVTMSEHATVQEALDVMIKQKTNGVVVVDKKSHLKGMLTVLDLIRHFVPDYLEADKHLAEFEAADVFASRATKIAKNAIKPLMTTSVATVKEDDSLMEAATRMTELQVRQLPVVDDHGVLLGLISRTGIKEAINDVMR